MLSPITPVTSIPVGLGTTFFNADLGSTVEVYIEISAGGSLPGSLYLLGWIPEANGGAGKWFPFPNPQDLDSAKNSGRQTGRWVIRKDSPYRKFHVLVPSAATVVETLIGTFRY